MTEIHFYHLTRKTLEQVLPELLAKTLERDLRAVVKTANAAQSEELAKFLWVYTQDSFLPHGTEEDKEAESQPIWITHKDENPNMAAFLFLTNMAESDKMSGYERVCNIFDGNNENALQKAREMWKALQSMPYKLTYWKQTDTGWSKE
ncbi:MAG: DNA polymerase III subunit chi [Alphaproteobacteria bacterium]|nr:DNA polymerase III subunit chi [Alphaproteobacteria bacterium]MCL2504867.1 DNA polymerase III subunit chi [Alphaproteobacteria bacterium]